MKRKNYFVLALFTMVACFSFTSCKKSDRANDTEMQSSQDNVTATSLFADLFNQVDEVASTQIDLNRLASPMNFAAIDSCEQITVAPALPNTSFPKTLMISFTDTIDCPGPNGMIRKGTIMAVFSGKYRDSNTVITINPSVYYVNGYHIEGTETVTNMGHNASGNLVYDIQIQNGKITTPTGGTISWNSHMQREWTAGDTTSTVWDDEYAISGTASGTSTTGNTFSLTITSPLHIIRSCKWINSGTMKLTPTNLGTRTIDFGSGTCDNQATVTLYGKTYNVGMP